VFQVSEQYIEKMMHHGSRRRLSGTIGSVPFTNDDVIAGSFSINGKAAESSDMKIGGVYIGELAMSFVPSFINKIDRDEYSGKEVSISIGLLLDPDNDTWIDVPCGVFTLDEESPQLSKNGIAVTGYDHMAKFDKKFTIDTTSSTLYGYLSYACTECGVELGITEEEVQALYNGTEVLGLYTPNDIETYRDLIYWVAQAAACFACCDRYGKLVLRKFGNPTGIVFDEDHRDDDVVFSGYTTKWTGVSFVDIETQMTRYYGLEVDDGLTMNLGGNPLLQLGTTDAIERRRRAVLQGVSEIRYTPFYFNSARDPIFDLGDEIPFTGGLSGNSTGCVMSISYSISSYSFEGYGNKPTLANARSKTDKNISGLMQNTVENEVTYYNFANLDVITFGSEQETTIARMTFLAAQETTVKILHEFIFDMAADLSNTNSYEIRYYLDGELINYKPYESLSPLLVSTDIPDTEQNEGEEETSTTYNADIQPVEVSICRDFFYILKNVEPNIRHVWEVRVITHGIEETTIQVNHAHVTIEGQRLYASDYWDGFLEFKDDFSLIPFGRMSLVSITENLTITLADNIIEHLSDIVEMIDLKTMELLPVADAVSITMEWLSLATEDRKKILTEDGKRIRIVM